MKSIKTVAELKKELHKAGIKTYTNKTQASYIKKTDLKKVEKIILGKGSILVRINSKQLDMVEEVLTIEKLKKVSPPGYADYYDGDKYKAYWKKGNELIAITETFNKNLFTYERM